MFHFLFYSFCLISETVEINNSEANSNVHNSNNSNSNKIHINDDFFIKTFDFSDKSKFLIFIVFNPEFCSNCKYFQSFLDQIPIEVKHINFYKNINLGSRFLSYTFPSFFIRDNCKTYKIIPESGEDLLEIVNNWEIYKNLNLEKINPFRKILEIDGFLSRIVGFVNTNIFLVIRLLHYSMEVVPSWFIDFLLIVTIVYLIYSIASVILENSTVITFENKNK